MGFFIHISTFPSVNFVKTRQKTAFKCLFSSFCFVIFVRQLTIKL
jgi:hypothetical protein